MEEILEENRKLKERIKELENLLQRKSSGNSRVYDEIRSMIILKVDKEVVIPEHLPSWQKKEARQRAERQIMSDLKWELRVRHVQDFKPEHIEPAKTYIDSYVLPEEFKKSRWEE